eukprot:scaffold569_cov408-Prasinococcus_capsulatus_cf.AAC.37
MPSVDRLYTSAGVPILESLQLANQLLQSHNAATLEEFKAIGAHGSTALCRFPDTRSSECLCLCCARIEDKIIREAAGPTVWRKIQKAKTREAGKSSGGPSRGQKRTKVTSSSLGESDAAHEPSKRYRSSGNGLLSAVTSFADSLLLSVTHHAQKERGLQQGCGVATPVGRPRFRTG